MRHFGLGLAVFFLSQLQIPAFGDERPNVIFLFTDDQAYDTLGCYGNPDVITPNIDGLAKRGVAFDRHYNTTSICMASRASVMTGLVEYRHGTNFSRGPMAKDIWNNSFPVRLRESGYRVGFAGKFGFAVADDPAAKVSENSYANLPVNDFDSWYGGTGQTHYQTDKNKYLKSFASAHPHSTLAYGAAASEFIESSESDDRPFCFTLFFKAPHRPVTPDPKFDSVYADTFFRKLPNYGREYGLHLAAQHKLGRQYERFESWGYDEEESYQVALRKYHQLIYAVDQAVGMITETLERTGTADNTVLIFSSDNGYFNGSHGLGSKVLPYEEGSRVPLIVADPRRTKNLDGQRCSSVTAGIDVAATILDLAGLEVDENMDGKSLLPLVDGTSHAIHDTIPLIQAWGPEQTYSLGVVSDRAKLVFWPYSQGMPSTEEWFELSDDPYERANLIEKPSDPTELQRMRKAYNATVRHWRRHAVSRHGYPALADIFGR